MNNNVKIGMIFLLLTLACNIVMAETLSTAMIIKNDTGNPDTMVSLTDKTFSPGETFEVYLEAKDLSARWGEGYAVYSYSYYSESGSKIWTSPRYSEEKRVSGKEWTFSKVHRITLPEEIPDGDYRIMFTVVDYHTDTEYKGNVNFSVGMNSTPPASSSAQSGSDSDTKFKTIVNDIELSLESVEKTDNRLTINLKGINRAEEAKKLDIYIYDTRIISSSGKEYSFSEYDGRGSLNEGVKFSPSVPILTDLYYPRPVPSAVSGIELLEIAFYSTDDTVLWRKIPVPYQAD